MELKEFENWCDEKYKSLLNNDKKDLNSRGYFN